MRPLRSTRPIDSGPLRYALALVAAAAATLVSLWAQALLQHTVLIAFLAALVLVAWYAGRGPALLTLAIGLVAADLLVVPPPGSALGAPLAAAIPLLLLALMGLLITAVSDHARRAEQQLRRSAVELEEQAIELEQQMDNSQSLQIELEMTNDQLENTNRELERSREFLEQAQRSARLGSWEWDIARDHVTWSDEMYRLFGIERGTDVTFDTFVSRLHADDREMVQSRLAEALEKKSAFSFDHRVVLPGGAVRWLEAQGRVVADAAGKPVRLIGSGQDVTTRRRTAEAQRFLAESSATLASSLDYSNTLQTVANLVVQELADWCAIATGDDSGRYQNIAVAHRDPERVRWAEEWARTHPPRFDTPTGVPNVLRTGTPEVYPVITPEVLRASGRSPEELQLLEELGLHSVMIVPMIARGRTLGAITFITAESRHVFDDDDLWLAKRLAGRAAIAIDNARLFEEATEARAQAEQANQAKTDFLAAMSHEFRTPLNAIAGYSQLLELGVYGELTEQQRDVLARLQRSQTHLLTLVEEVLGFARIEAGKIRMEITDVPVREALSRACDMIGPQLQAKKLKFEQTAECEDIRVRADADRLEQIFVNLLSNSVKFTADGGSVRVGCDADDGWVTVQVTDTGVGIPPDQLENVFEAFTQLPHAASKRSSGVGLGLAISRDLARAMGGEITASSAPGAGSTFSLRLPSA